MIQGKAALLVLLLLLTGVSHGAIYRWTDDNGVTHYGENPPPEVDAQRIDAASGAEPDDSEDDNAGNTDPSGQDGDHSAADETASSGGGGDSETQSMEEFCAEMEEELELLDSERELRVETGDGQVKPLEGEEREQRRQALEAQIEQNC